MNRIYKEYRKWLDSIEDSIRMNFPGWNVEIREHRKGVFALCFGKSLGTQDEEIIYLNERQIEWLYDAESVELMKFLKEECTCHKF